MANIAAEGVKYALTNSAITNGINVDTNQEFASATKLMAEAARTTFSGEVAVESFAAAAAIKQIVDHGHLPGVSKGEHGSLLSDTVDTVISNQPAVLTFPALRTFRLVKNGETSTNNYILVKQSKDAEWKLQKAWLTDSNGQTVQEWPVK